jgi:hypothetical protein
MPLITHYLVYDSSLRATKMTSSAATTKIARSIQPSDDCLARLVALSRVSVRAAVATTVVAVGTAAGATGAGSAAAAPLGSPCSPCRSDGPSAKSSLYANRSSSGTFSASTGPAAPPTATSSAAMISALLRAHRAHVQAGASRAMARRVAGSHSSPPIWPLVVVSMKLRIATRAVRMPQAGCQLSSWWPEMLRQISRLASKRPEGVRKRNEGGRSG